jgi:hypothetical protein
MSVCVRQFAGSARTLHGDARTLHGGALAVEHTHVERSFLDVLQSVYELVGFNSQSFEPPILIWVVAHHVPW